MSLVSDKTCALDAGISMILVSNKMTSFHWGILLIEQNRAEQNRTEHNFILIQHLRPLAGGIRE